MKRMSGGATRQRERALGEATDTSVDSLKALPAVQSIMDDQERARLAVGGEVI